MALYSDPNSQYSHRVRIVLEEKGVLSEIIDTDNDKLSSELLEVSPYAQLPVLADRDVALYDSVTLMEYLDERFPHPPLLPVYPGTRANMRLYIQRIEKDWCSIFDNLVRGNLKEIDIIKNQANLLNRIVKIEKITSGEKLDKPEQSATAVVSDIEIFIPLKGLIDIDKEVNRLNKQVIDMNGRLNTIYKKLNNKNFIDRAPSDVIANEKKKKEKYEAMLKKLEENLNALIK